MELRGPADAAGTRLLDGAEGEGVVAGIAPQSPEMAAQSVPPMWNTYLAVEDVDAASERVTAAGGQLAMAPFDVMDAGRMAFASIRPALPSPSGRPRTTSEQPS